MSSNFVAAALPSVITHIENLFKNYSEYCEPKDVKTFLDNTVNKFLTSIGIALDRNREINPRIVTTYSKMLKKIKEKSYLEDCTIIVDSAGYQIQTGYVSREDIPKFTNLYYDEFITNHSDLFTKAFNLDLVPGYSFCPFKSWKDIKDLSIESYTKASNLPDDIREKMIYVHHFRTPKMHQVYKSIMPQFIPKFKNFAVGGLVSMSNSKNPPTCVMYSVPLVDILHHMVNSNIKKASFHVLGETEFKSVFLHCLFEKHIKEKLGIELSITYDSSSIFKIVALGRYTFIFDGKNIWRLGLRSDIVKSMFAGSIKTNEEVFFDVLNTRLSPYNFKKVNSIDAPIYKDDGSFNTLYYSYGLLQMFDLFTSIQEYCRKQVERLYPIYLSEDYVTFNQEVGNLLLSFNNGKQSKKLNIRSNIVWNSLKMIESMDLDYGEYLVKNYMYSEENRDLPDTH